MSGGRRSIAPIVCGAHLVLFARGAAKTSSNQIRLQDLNKTLLPNQIVETIPDRLRRTGTRVALPLPELDDDAPRDQGRSARRDRRSPPARRKIGRASCRERV